MLDELGWAGRVWVKEQYGCDCPIDDEQEEKDFFLLALFLL
ncbi:hypothetical protein [Bacillus sp. DNRA2]|nr:hypothetical protein [Bacillus sp. DNRA2]